MSLVEQIILKKKAPTFHALTPERAHIQKKFSSLQHASQKCPHKLYESTINGSRNPYGFRVQLTPDNSNQNRFPLDFRHTFIVISPSVTRTLDNSNLQQTQSNFCFRSDHFYTILLSITRTML